MNEEEFITKFYSCDNEEQFLKDICHDLNSMLKVLKNWNALKQCVIDLFNTSQDTTYLNVLKKIQEFEKDNNANTSN